jgi:hypothetical protein
MLSNLFFIAVTLFCNISCLLSYVLLITDYFNYNFIILKVQNIMGQALDVMACCAPNVQADYSLCIIKL